MALKQHPSKGPGHWQIKISQGSKKNPLYFTFSGTEPEARQYEYELKRAYRPPAALAIVPTFTDLLPDFVGYYETVSTPGTVASFIRSWKNLDPFFGKIRPNELNMMLIQHYKKQRLTHDNGRESTVSKRTINKELSYLSSVVKWCESEESGNIIDPLPFRIKGFPGKQTRAPLPKILTEDEINRLLQALPGSIRGICAAMYYGGLRFSEAAKLERKNIDLERGIMILRGKGGKERTVPILDELRPFLEGTEPGLIFRSRIGGGEMKDIRSSMLKAAKRAGIEKHVHPHLLRHTMGGHGINTISLRALQAIMGHSTPTVTMRYTQVNEEMLLEEMGKFRNSAGITASQNKKP